MPRCPLKEGCLYLFLFSCKLQWNLYHSLNCLNVRWFSFNQYICRKMLCSKWYDMMITAYGHYRNYWLLTNHQKSSVTLGKPLFSLCFHVFPLFTIGKSRLAIWQKKWGDYKRRSPFKVCYISFRFSLIPLKEFVTWNVILKWYLVKHMLLCFFVCWVFTSHKMVF